MFGRKKVPSTCRAARRSVLHRDNSRQRKINHGRPRPPLVWAARALLRRARRLFADGDSFAGPRRRARKLPQQRAACEGDAMRLCSAHVPDVDSASPLHVAQPPHPSARAAGRCLTAARSAARAQLIASIARPLRPRCARGRSCFNCQPFLMLRMIFRIARVMLFLVTFRARPVGEKHALGRRDGQDREMSIRTSPSLSWPAQPDVVVILKASSTAPLLLELLVEFSTGDVGAIRNLTASVVSFHQALHRGVPSMAR